LAILWHVIGCAYWYERVLPVVVEPIRQTAMPFEELRSVFRRATWGGFKQNWYKPELTKFWPVADISDGPVTEVFQRLYKTEPEWLLHNAYMIYSAVKCSVLGHSGGVEPCDYVCVWRRPGSAAGAALSVWNPAYGQFVQDMGSWSDAE
jgi:hypothetical protein